MIVKRSLTMQQQIPAIKIATKGERYYISRSVDLPALKQQQQVNINQSMDIEEMKEQRRQEEYSQDNEKYYQDENWMIPKNNKKRKITPSTSAAGKPDTEKQRWLQELPLRNSFSSLTEETDVDPTNKDTTHSSYITKPPPIFVEAQIIDPLIELLNNIVDNDNYTIKQTKLDQVKIQTNTPEVYRNVIKALKEKNAIYHTYQLKTERSYKIVIRGLHPKISTKKLSDELAKIGHQTRTINNITKYDTKQPLPLFLIELEPRTNNKEIYNIKKILNTIVTVEPPRYKKDIPQCMRCQQYGHTKNYCNRSPACVKCAKNHLTIHCPNTGKIEEVRCYNCNGNHPASYKGCIIRKQLQRKLFPPLRNRSTNNYKPQQGTTENDTALIAHNEPNIISGNINPQGYRSYAQVTQNISQATLNQNQSKNIEDATEIKEMLKQSIKSTEMLGKMVSELNTTLRQQVQQTTIMLQLLTNLLSKK